MGFPWRRSHLGCFCLALRVFGTSINGGCRRFGNRSLNEHGELQCSWQGIYKGPRFTLFSKALVTYQGEGLNLQSFCVPFLPSVAVGESFRPMTSTADTERRKHKLRELQLIRRKTNLRKAHLNEEEMLVWRLEKARRKEAFLVQRLRKYELPEDPQPLHDPEIITSEQLQSLKKIGYKNTNYVQVGRRGVYGGVVQNMHLHWKKHETVQIDCGSYKAADIREMAAELARLSGGIAIDIHQGNIIIMYRGRNYNQPKGEMIPRNTLTKRRALYKSKYLQALEMLKKYINNLENELQILWKRKENEVLQETIPGSLSAGTSTLQEVSGKANYFKTVVNGMEETMLREFDEDESSERFIGVGMICARDSDTIEEKPHQMLELEKKFQTDAVIQQTQATSYQKIDEETTNEGRFKSEKTSFASKSDINKACHHQQIGREETDKFLDGQSIEEINRDKEAMHIQKNQENIQAVEMEDKLDYYSDLEEVPYGWKDIQELKFRSKHCIEEMPKSQIGESGDSIGDLYPESFGNYTDKDFEDPDAQEQPMRLQCKTSRVRHVRKQDDNFLWFGEDEADIIEEQDCKLLSVTVLPQHIDESAKTKESMKVGEENSSIIENLSPR
eukprot:c21983_g1_i1 orf=442-2289(-)